MTLPSFQLAFFANSSSSNQSSSSSASSPRSSPVSSIGAGGDLDELLMSDLDLAFCEESSNDLMTECSDPDHRLSLQPDLESWTNRKRETGCELRLSEFSNSITWLSSQAHEEQQRWNSETSFEPISSWTQMTSSCYESGDSLDSFASPSSTTTTTSYYSLPPTPPATPPNSAQDWLPPASTTSIPAKIGGRFSCDSCSKVFGDRAHLAEHHRYRHSDDRPHRCPECSKGFKSKSNLNQHIRTSHERPRFDCQLCERTAFSESGYRYHLLTSHPEPNRQKPFECPSCDKSFVQQKLLRKHLASRHSDDSDARRHVCPFCPASFKRKDHVTRHVTDTHSLVTKLFDCSTCDAKFQSASHLRQHERLHEDRGGFYECPVCKERIVRKKGFKRHLDLHKKAATVEVSTSGCFPSLTGLNSQNSCSAFDQQTLTRQFF